LRSRFIRFYIDVDIEQVCSGLTADEELSVNIQAWFAPFVRPIMRRTIAMRTSQLELLPRLAGRVVFLGDSITELGCWNEWFPDLPTLNRGVGGDTVGGVHARLDVALHDPVAVSLLIGTNDLGGMGPTRSVDGIANQARELVLAIRRTAPDSALLVNSLMPRVRSMAGTIRDLNERYARIAVDAGATYVDLWPALATSDGALRDEFTLDHLHLNGAGYRAWVEVLRSHLSPWRRQGEGDVSRTVDIESTSGDAVSS
jgi:lysophospholipase L1-like esterase